ncbi:MAG: alpha-amylase family glycosyl hydrolase [Bryobacteraceae bacterium]
MPKDIFDPAVAAAIGAARRGDRRVFPSPVDWRDSWIYFLFLDRFNNPAAPPRHTWNHRFGFRQGGTFRGVTQQLDYIRDLGAGAIWISPVLKNPKPDFEFNYHGYATQDFLNLDERFASDGTRETAEHELRELVDAAHDRGLFVIADMVLNHSARVFDYVRPNGVVSSFADSAVMNGPLGSEPAIEWINGFGFPRTDWTQDLPAPAALSPDDAVWPSDLQRREFFRRRGSKLTDNPGASFVPGDFGEMRQLVAEYDARPASQAELRARYGVTPVLAILIRAYHYLIAKYDFDGFRIDTVKYVSPDAIETFGNSMREFALSIGKKNFFTFGEIYDDEQTIAAFTGRNGAGDGFGIDAALDFPLFFKLPAVAKGFGAVESLRTVFQDRKNAERDLLSSHGEAGRFFVSFLDNHDQNERVRNPATPPEQVTLALALLFTLQGIPCVYYGTEQSLNGTEDGLGSLESVREALWGKSPAFDRANPAYQEIRKLAQLRATEPALRYGRLYFREVSGNGVDFGQSFGAKGIVAYSRILVDREVVVVANTDPAQVFEGFVLVDRDLGVRDLTVAYSNRGNTGRSQVHVGQVAAVPVRLAGSEVQVLVPQ